MQPLGSRNNQHSFATIPSVHIGRSQFDRSFTIKDTFNFDYLIPIFVDEILPGDTAKVSVNSFGRLATQIKPIMDNMYIDFFFFFVPNRLTYDHWQRMNGEQVNPGDSTDFILPKISMNTSTGAPVGSIYDKYGIPTGIKPLTLNNSLPFRCYNLIWNEWFRDQNMQNSVPVPRDQGPDPETDFILLKRGKRHDYFTSALPWPQKGPAVSIPIGTSAQVKVDPTNPLVNTPNFIRPDHTLHASNNLQINASGKLTDSPATSIFAIDPNGSLFADLSTATAATINQLRQAFMMQSLFELDARGGTRYIEILRAHFGVISPDARLQRPEYLGGGTTRINSHPVAQTAPSDTDTTPQANLSSFATTATGVGDNIGFSKSFVEHGYVIGLACARGEITYQQGLNKMFSRSTRYDFFWPKLQELGEQAVLNQEIYTQGTSADTGVFGYQERYSEYRYKPSEIHGEFRSTYAQSLDYWHLAQDYGTLPALGSDFIVQDTPIQRAIAVETEPHLLFDCYFKYQMARPMLAYSVPATLGRF